jgi:hypothetical protein
MIGACNASRRAPAKKTLGIVDTIQSEPHPGGVFVERNHVIMTEKSTFLEAAVCSAGNDCEFLEGKQYQVFPKPFKFGARHLSTS